MVPSAVVNEAIVFCTVLAMRGLVRRTPKEKLPESFRARRGLYTVKKKARIFAFTMR